MSTQITAAGIESIVREQDPVLRNLHITRTYADLSEQITGVIGSANINWCTFATWASKTAGQFIRLDSLEAAIDEFHRGKDWVAMLREALPGMMQTLGIRIRIKAPQLHALMDVITRRTATHVAAGNLLVFEELAPMFARFIEIRLDPSVGEMQWAMFLNPMSEGTGKDHLFHAFSEYRRAMTLEDPKQKAESILLANLLVGYHEQIRLDAAIDGSLNAPVDQLFRDVLLNNMDSWLEISAPAFVRAIISGLIKSRLSSVVDRMAERWRRISTKQLMIMQTPSGKLDLSEDLQASFPEDLRQLHHPELKQILIRLDRTPDTTFGSGAKDWSLLEDRMNFIADLFRAYQQDPNMLRRPFTPDQEAAIQANTIPTGKL